MFKEIFKNAKLGLKLKEVLEIRSNASYLRAMRVNAGEALNLKVGKIIPIENIQELDRKILMAKSKNRPFLVAERETDNKLFLLLIDTK